MFFSQVDYRKCTTEALLVCDLCCKTTPHTYAGHRSIVSNGVKDGSEQLMQCTGCRNQRRWGTSRF